MREQAQLHEDYIAQLSVDDSATTFFGKVEDRLTDESVDVTDANAVQHAVAHQAMYLERFATRVQQLRVHISQTDSWKEQRKKRSDLWGNAKRKLSAVMPLLYASFGLSARKGKGESKDEDEREANATEHEGQGEADASEPTDNRRAKRAWTDKSGRQGIFEEKTTSRNEATGSHTKVRRLHSAPQSAVAAEAEDNNGTVRRSETGEQDAYDAAAAAAIAAEEQLNPNDRTSQAMLVRVKRASAKEDAEEAEHGSDSEDELVDNRPTKRAWAERFEEKTTDQKGGADGAAPSPAEPPPSYTPVRRMRKPLRATAAGGSNQTLVRGISSDESSSGEDSGPGEKADDEGEEGGSKRGRSKSRSRRKARAESDGEGEVEGDGEEGGSSRGRSKNHANLNAAQDSSADSADDNNLDSGDSSDSSADAQKKPAAWKVGQQVMAKWPLGDSSYKDAWPDSRMRVGLVASMGKDGVVEIDFKAPRGMLNFYKQGGAWVEEGTPWAVTLGHIGRSAQRKIAEEVVFAATQLGGQAGVNAVAEAARLAAETERQEADAAAKAADAVRLRAERASAAADEAWLEEQAEAARLQEEEQAAEAEAAEEAAKAAEEAARLETEKILAEAEAAAELATAALAKKEKKKRKKKEKKAAKRAEAEKKEAAEDTAVEAATAAAALAAERERQEADAARLRAERAAAADKEQEQKKAADAAEVQAAKKAADEAEAARVLAEQAAEPKKKKKGKKSKKKSKQGK